MAETIRRSLVLQEYDIKETTRGKQPVFSIRFVKKNGELVFIPRAVACGLPFNAKENRMRGVLPVDTYGNATSHPTAVHIDAIMEWNGKKVIL